MVPLNVAGLKDFEEEALAGEIEEVHQPFQQELREHLLVLQRKLDALSSKLDSSLESCAGPGAKDAGGGLRPRSQSTATHASPKRPEDDPGSLEELPSPPDGLVMQKTGAWRGIVSSLTGRQKANSSAVQKLDFVLPNAPAVASSHVPPPQQSGSDGTTRSSCSKEGKADADASIVKETKAPMTPPDLPQPPVSSDQDSEAASSVSDAADPPRDTVNRRGSRRSSAPRMSVGSVGSSAISGDRQRLGRLRSWLNLNDEDTVPDRKSRMGLVHAGFHRMINSGYEFAETRWIKVQDNLLYRLVHGACFQILSSGMIILNVVMIGVIANARLEDGLSRRPESGTWESVEIAFCIFFTMELVVRVVSERITFMFGPEWKWNLFDFFLVVFSIADVILNEINDAGIANANVPSARILRFVRFIRIVRIARAVRAFHSLRVVVFAIIESLLSLIWCLLVVGLIIYMFAILFLYGVTEHLADPSRDEANTAQLLAYYGSVPHACLTLFMTISGGVDWKDAMEPLTTIHWIYWPLFTFYVFLMVIGVLNVVMGAFVAATAEISQRDREVLVKNEMRDQQLYTRKIKLFFREADKDRSGLLSWTEFKEHLKIPKVSAYFRALELDVSQAHVLFKLLDRDGSNEVSLEEFLQGCVRLKGQAKSLEVNMLLYESKRLFSKLSDFMEAISSTGALQKFGVSEASEASDRRLRKSVTPFIDD